MADTLLGISELVLQKLLNVSTVPGMVFRAGQQLEGKKKSRFCSHWSDSQVGVCTCKIFNEFPI